MAGAIIAPGARARQLRASFDVPGGRLAPGRVGGAPTWSTRTLFRRDLGGGAFFGDIAPEWGGTGSPMAAGVYVWGVVVGRTLPGGDRRNLGAQLQKLSELAHFLCDQNLALF